MPPASTPDISRPRPSKYCLYPDEWEAIKSQPVSFYCDRTLPENCDPADPECQWEVVETDVPYVLASADVVVEKTYRHAEKQLILKERCPHPETSPLEAKDYYTWKCHPGHNWGSIFAITLWENLSRSDKEKPQDGDHFNVYIRKDAEPSGSLVCPDSGGQGLGTSSEVTVGDVFLASILEDEIITVNIDGEEKRAMWFFSSDAVKGDIEDSTVRRKVDTITLKEMDYDVFIKLLAGYIDKPDKYVFLVEKDVVPDDDALLPDAITYDIFVVLAESKPTGKSLQLGTFNPLPPEVEAPWYNFYIPESKPVVYLYPEKSTEVSVKINPRDGFVTVSEPLYNPETGWEVLAFPNSTLKFPTTYDPQPTTYPYLYYETMVVGYQLPKKGFMLQKENLRPFLRNYIQKLGLRGQEIEDFLEYWIGRFSEIDKKYFFVAFFSQEEIEYVDPLTIEPEPMTEIRIRAYFKPLDSPYLVEAPDLPPVPKREGFTVIEWGGILDERNDS